MAEQEHTPANDPEYDAFRRLALAVDSATRDPEAVKALLSARESAVRMARRQFRDDADVEDCVQETLFKALRKARLSASVSHFRAWLATITFNTMFDLKRRRKRRREVGALDQIDHDPPDPSIAESGAELDARSRVAFLRGEIDRLKGTCHKVLRARHMLGLPDRIAAALLGMRLDSFQRTALRCEKALIPKARERARREGLA